ncbi:MAG: hypothetical protein EBS86_01280 [Crocinitomicaceae bacterium]|nr:hypothetical protein [Crocinitomicaceae bacterium]
MQKALTDTEDLFQGYRNSDPATSKRAYLNTKITHGSHRHLLLSEYYKTSLEQEFPTRGLTDEEAGERSALIKKTKCPWKRCSELRKLGYIVPNGQERKSSTNQYQMVCIITMEGIRALERIELTRR